MPFALLLSRISLELAFGAGKLSPWVRLVRDEEVLIDRARGAFATRWFGTSLPLAGSSLRIAIDNLRPLQERFAGVRAASAPDSRLDIGTPLAAMLGTAMGSLLHPFTIVPMALLAAIEGTGSALFWLFLLLATIAPPIALAASGIGVVAAPFVLAIDWPALNDRLALLAAAGDFVPVLTSCVAALVENWDAIVGPIGHLAGTILDVQPSSADGAAWGPAWWQTFFAALVPLSEQVVLLPMLTGAVVIIIAATGSLLKKWATILPPFLAFAGATVDAIRALLDDFFDALNKSVQSPADVLRDVLGAAARLVAPLGERLSKLLDEFGAFLEGRVPALKSVFSTWWNWVTQDLATVFATHPLIRLIDTLKNRLDATITYLKEGFWTGVKVQARRAAGPFGEILVEKLRAKLDEPPKAPSEPFFPDLKLPDASAMLALLQQPMSWDALSFSPAIGEMPKVPSALVTPTSVFAGARRELEAELTQEPGAALAAAHADEKRLREFLFAVVARQLPAKVQPHFDHLREAFRALDNALRPLEPKTSERTLPVRELPDDHRVLPVIGRLTVRSRGASESEVRQWLPVLREALGKQAYLKVA